ncbi:MAG: hypothetical protein ACK5IM_06420, partial [Demequina sp.]
MPTHALRRRATAGALSLALTAGLVAAGAVAAPAATAAERPAPTATDTTYLADTLGLDASTAVETVTYDRFQWLLQQSGTFAFVIGSTHDANFAASVRAADSAARDAGVQQIDWFDPTLSGYEGSRNLDTRNPGGISLAATSQAIYGKVWDNV